MRSEASITRVNSEATAQNMTSGQRSVVEKDSTITEVSHLLLVQNEENRNPADFMVTLTDANRGPAARAALGKPAVRFNEIITVAPLRTAGKCFIETLCMKVKKIFKMHTNVYCYCRRVGGIYSSTIHSFHVISTISDD